MKRSIEKPPADMEQNLSMFEKPSRKKTVVLAALAIAGGAWAISDRAEAASDVNDNIERSLNPSKTSKNKFALPSEGSYLRIPRYKKYGSLVDARNNILSQFADQETTLKPLPNLSEYDKDFYDSCVYGKLRYPVSHENGISNSGRIDDNTVGMDIFSVDDCWGKFRDSRTIIGLEVRDDNTKDFEPAEIAPGIIKRFGSSPEYGSYYAGKFNVGESCKDNPDLQVRFTIENVTRSGFSPMVLRVRPERTQPTITCEL